MKTDDTVSTEKLLYPGFIKQACQRYDIELKTLVDDWVFIMKYGGRSRRIIGFGSDLNDAVADRIGNNKTAQYVLLDDQRVPAVEHHPVKRADLDKLHSDLGFIANSPAFVLKPIDGAGGQDVELKPNLEAVIETIEKSPAKLDLVISPWLDIVSEKRIVMLDNQPLIAYDKTQPAIIHGLKMFNLNQGAIPVNFIPSDQELVLAQKARQACGLRLCSIDIATLADGQQKIMEINSGVAMELYARSSTENYSLVATAYEKIIRTMFDI